MTHYGVVLNHMDHISCSSNDFIYEVAAIEMLEELQSHCLIVIKVQKENGGWIRVCLDVNPPWYRDFCASYQRSRRRYPKSRTIIKRCCTINALKRLAAGKKNGIYIERLLPFVEEYASQLILT